MFCALAALVKKAAAVTNFAWYDKRMRMEVLGRMAVLCVDAKVVPLDVSFKARLCTREELQTNGAAAGTMAQGFPHHGKRDEDMHRSDE
jgi:hypothetical protein